MAAVVPEFVTVTVFAALVVPVDWLPKATVVGLSDSVTAATDGAPQSVSTIAAIGRSIRLRFVTHYTPDTTPTRTQPRNDSAFTHKSLANDGFVSTAHSRTRPGSKAAWSTSGSRESSALYRTMQLPPVLESLNLSMLAYLFESGFSRFI